MSPVSTHGLSDARFVAPNRIRLRSTLAGRMVIPVATAGLAAGWLAGGSASSLFTVSALALLGLCALAGRWHLAGLRVRWPNPLVTRVAELKVATLEVQNVGRLKALHVSVYPGQASTGGSRSGGHFDELGGGAHLQLAVACVFPSRGRARELPVELVSAFPFGLFEAVATFSPVADVLVMPRSGSLRALERWLPRARSKQSPRESKRVHQGEEEFDGVRELREGETARRIHWGLSARADRWIRRVFVAEGRGSIELVLVTKVQRVGVARRRDLGFEAAVALAATLANALVREGAQVRFRIDDGDGRPIVGRRGLRQLNGLLAEAQHTAGDPWSVQKRLSEHGPNAGTQRLIVLAGGGLRRRPADRMEDGSTVVDADHRDLGEVFRSARTQPEVLAQ